MILRAAIIGAAFLMGAVLGGGILPSSPVWAKETVATGGVRLGPSDARYAKAAFKLIKKNKWTQAAKQVRRISDPLLKKTFTWLDMSRPDGNAKFDDIAAFLDTHPNWPKSWKLRRRAEEAMTVAIAPEKVLGWFSDKEPVSVDGEMRLIAALFDFDRNDEARALVKNVWINGDFGRVQEKAFYRRYRKLLTGDDHWARLDRLLWDGRYSASRRMLWKFKGLKRKLAEARFMLRHRRGNVDRAIARIPQSARSDPGLVYERVRWRHKKGRDEGALDLLLQVTGPVPRPDLWWRQRGALARWALRKGRITDAYRLASNHGLDHRHPAQYAAAEWLSGWIALRFLNDNQVAYDHFTRMFASVTMPVSSARGAYWSARAAEALGRTRDAKAWHTIAARYPATFYGQISHAELTPGAPILLGQGRAPDGADRLRFEAHELVRVVRMLALLDQQEHMRPFIEHLAAQEDTESWRTLAANLAVSVGRNDIGLKVAKRARRDGQDLGPAAFPVLSPPPLPKRYGAPPPEAPLVLAIIRQESAFQTTAKSRAGARGLMQLLPRTAHRVSRKLRLPYARRKLTENPDYNMIIGQAYIGDLLEQFDGTAILAVAAYNAGPSRARAWIQQFGDPRSPDVDPIDWIESIPFDETRNYVQRVLEGLHVYRMQLGIETVAFEPELPALSTRRN